MPDTVGLPSGGGAHLAFENTRFDVTREVARGGMGRILAATDRLLGRTVAIKVALTNDPVTQQRIGREAALLSSLAHDSLPPIYELGTVRGLTYFVTRLVDGETLEQRLKAAPADWASSLPLVADVAEVMDHAHRQGVIHRDLKPNNILIDRAGRVVIVDWGIARRIEPLEFNPGPEALHDLDLTAPGIAIGTPGYWAPEQRRGEAGSVSSDVYALGAIVYRMAVGRTVRGAPARPEIAAVMAGAPRWLVDLVARAMARNPRDRHASSAAFAAELRAGLSAASRPSGAGAPADRSRSRRWHVMPAAALVRALVSHDARPCDAAASRIAKVLAASGHWRGDFGEMAFAVSGDQVRGVYSHDHGMFRGRVVDDRIVGQWCEAPYASANDTGDASFLVAGAGEDARVVGHYRYAWDDKLSGRWELEHLAAPAPPDLIERLAGQAWRCGAL